MTAERLGGLTTPIELFVTGLPAGLTINRTTGALTQPAGKAGCVAAVAGSACTVEGGFQFCSRGHDG